MRKIFVLLTVFASVCTYAQQANEKPPHQMANYHPTEEKINDLVHTKLDVRFDIPQSRMYGKAWVTLHPHFYATDSLVLDAKGMNINQVAIMKGTRQVPLKYSYDSMNLRIALDKKYKSNENYTIYIDYVAIPNGYKAAAYGLMPGEKGLYFINPTGAIKGKPTQIWTQGETEANSYWVPTLDKPNQKQTQEISMTIPSAWVSLSNGLMVKSTVNANKTRTDVWKMDQPHSSYLMFMAAGDYAVVHDKWKNKPVDYYVEPAYLPYAKKIFGLTPEMIGYFSTVTGVEYPWPKYAQITGRDYIFGAMENTSATLHADQVQQDARELVDGNGWEETIAHELFHQWFGDYVTAESWSNITLNESFADYSETLWKEYKYGKDVSQEQLYADRRNYWGNPGNADVNLVRFNYRNALDVFDGVSYQKGGNILHMLRKFVGDEAFSQSLKNYLQTNKYKNGEAQQLRLAFEEVTGKDLNWFFNQWYYGKGHPKLDISYDYSTPGNVSVNIRQTQRGTIFQLPIDIDIHTGNQISRHQVWMKDSVATFVFPVTTKPDLVNVDGDKDLLLEKTDHKTPSEFLYQYQHATGYINRREAVAYFINTPDAAGRTAFLLQAFNDPRASLRRMILTNINYGKDAFAKEGLAIVRAKAAKENDKTVQAAAVSVLGSIKDGSSLSLLKSLTRDQSYSVAGNALLAVASMDSVAALTIARSLISQPAKGNLLAALTSVLAKYGTAQDDKYIYDQFEIAGINGRIGMLNDLGIALQKSNDDAFVNQQLTMLTTFKNELPAFFGEFASPMVEKVVADVTEARKNKK